MARVRNIQHRFTHGELDPLMIGRTDIDQYYGAAATLTNVFTLPQGGVKRRDGLEHIGRVLGTIEREASPTITAPNGGTTASANDDDTGTQLLTTTNISTTDGYVVVQYDMGTDKSLGKVCIAGLHLSSATSSADWAVEYSSDAAMWKQAGASFALTATGKDFSRRIHADARYVRLVRNGTEDLGTDKVELDEFHVYTESGTSETKIISFEFNKDQSYVLVVSDKNIAIYSDGEYIIDIRADDYTDAVIPNITYTQSLDTLLLFNEEVAVHKMVRGSATDVWTYAAVTWDFTPQYDFTPTTSTPAGTVTPSSTSGNVTVTASGTPFSSGDVGSYIEGNAGRLRITEYVANNEVKGVTVIPFFNTDAVSSGDWYLLGGYEDAWSSTRGYPICGTFHEGRLIIGGSRDRPNTLWMSRVNDFFDFDQGQLLDDDAIYVSIDSDQLNEIVNVYSGRALMIFTTGAEYVVLQQLGDPITPTNVNIKRQTRIGSEVNLAPQEFEGGVLYAQRGGQSIQEFIYDDAQDAFSNNFISILSSHLVRTPVDMALRRATSTEDGAYLLLVRTDGDLTVANILRSQNITSFTRQTTDGNFKSCGVDVNDMYFVVERTINNNTHRYLERFNSDHYMDASLRYTANLPTDTFAGLSHLEGESVRVKADDNVLNNETVSSGSVVIDRNAEDYVEIGLNFDPTIKDLPVEIAQIGSAKGGKYNISDVTLNLYQTAGIYINGKRMYYRGYETDSENPEIFTGIKKKRGFRGYDTTGQITITQVDPLPMTILNIIKRVRVSG